MSDAIIPALKHRIPLELRSKAWLGESSTRMGDLVGSPRVASLFYFLFALRGGGFPSSAKRDDGSGTVNRGWRDRSIGHSCSRFGRGKFGSGNGR